MVFSLVFDFHDLGGMLDDLGDAVAVKRADFAKDPLGDLVEVIKEPLLPNDADVAPGASEAPRIRLFFRRN